MKLAVIVLLACCLTSLCFAQSRIELRVYQNTDIFDVKYTDNQTTSRENHTKFNRVSLSVVATSKKKILHELELFIPDFGRPFDRVSFPLNYDVDERHRDSKARSFSFRYSLTKMFSSDKQRIRFGLGVGINPYFVRSECNSVPNYSFYSRYGFYGGSVNLIPCMNATLATRLKLSLSLPLKIYDGRDAEHFVDSPVIPLQQQRQEHFQNIFFERTFTMRLGLGYSF